MIRTFQEYDALAMRTAHHPTGSERALLYVGCALAGEAGEVANEIKKVSRDDMGVLTEERRLKLIKEMGDTLWYLNSLANEIGTTLYEVAEANIVKLEERHGMVAKCEQPRQGEHRVVSDPGSGIQS